MQELVDAGEINEADAEGHPRANIITRAVGDQAESVDLDKVIGSVADGDRFLLCSDGLSKVLDDDAILGLLAATPGRGGRREVGRRDSGPERHRQRHRGGD